MIAPDFCPQRELGEALAKICDAVETPPAKFALAGFPQRGRNVWKSAACHGLKDGLAQQAG